MPKLPVVSGRQLIKALEKADFQKVSQKGSHIKLQKVSEGRKITVIVPGHRAIKPGTLRNGILKPSGISVKELLRLLKK